MQTSAEILLSNIERLYENAFNLMKGFQEATMTNQNIITVPLKNSDGGIEELQINSFQQVLIELSRLEANFKSLTNSDNISYILNGDGSMSQTTKTSFINAEYLEQFSFPKNPSDITTAVGSDCIVDMTSTIRNMVFPNVKIPIAIDSTIKTDIKCLLYEINDGWEEIPDDTTLLNLKYLMSEGGVSATYEEITLSLQKEQVKYFGKFTVLETTTIGNVSTIKLSDVKYTGINVIDNSINLKIGDYLVNKNGTAKFIIDEINIFAKVLKITRVEGSGNVSVGVDNLYFNAIVENNTTNVVGVPVQPNKKLVIFLSTENLKTISYPSIGIKLDTSTYNVTTDDGTFTLDEYFNTYVTNISEYLFSLIKETTIPISLGIVPETPTLLASNFKVVQINRHLTDAKSTAELESLNAKKQKIKNDIDYKTTEITTIQNEVDTLKFKSLSEKNNRIARIQLLRQEINTLNGNLLTVTRDLNDNAIKYGLKAVKPKYRTLGIWDIQKPIFSPLSKPQNIVKYEVQYRYLSKNIDTIESTTYKMINNEGKEVNIVVSPWNPAESRSLNKVYAVDGSLTWETPVLDSVDDININQVNIAINEGESVEIRVRAISEAGYPVAPLKSDWSDILRVDFPNNLTESSLNTIVSKNEEDLRKAEFNDILQSSGALTHISRQVQEAEKLYLHISSDIASGFYTPEQKNIPLDVYLQSLRNDLNILMNKNQEEKIKIELIDFNNETYSVINNSTIELSAGNYSDALNLLDSTKWGSIIRKQGFIKIKNSNINPLELKTLVPGTIFDSNTASKYYNVPTKTQDALIQRSKQVIYFRNVDITAQNEDIFKLVKEKLPNTNTFPQPIYIDNSATEDSKNIIYYDNSPSTDGNVKIAKLLPNAGNDFIAITKEHPLYDSENLNALLPEFERIQKYTNTLKQERYQEEPYLDGNLLTNGIGFVDNDFFNIGENSVGAFLYPIISNINTVSVTGNTTISTLIVPANTEILIPFVFEYRMIDRLGKINGSNDLTINDIITYSKKIGIDLLLNNEQFRFDINVTAKLKSTVVPIESLNVTSIVGLFGGEEPETLT